MTYSTSIDTVESSVVMRISQFLGYEAMLLDENKVWEWYALLDDRFIYEIPLREVTDRTNPNGFVKGTYRQRDNKGNIKLRIDKLFTRSAWAEDPPSRTMRGVGSIYVQATDQQDVFAVSSTSLVYRTRAQDPGGDWIPTRRLDHVIVSDAEIKLLSRTVWLPDVILQTPNLGVFL